MSPHIVYSDNKVNWHNTLTWQSLGPLDCRDDLPATQPVESGHEAGGSVWQGAVVAGVNGVWLDGLQQGQHCGNKLRHALGHKGAALDCRTSRQLGCVALRDHLYAVQLFGFACCTIKRGEQV